MLLGFHVATFAEVGEADEASAVNEVLGRQIAIGECLPKFVLAIQDDRISQPEFADAALYVGFLLSKSEFRSMHANDDQTRCGVTAVPLLHIGQRAYGAKRGVVPEIDEHDFAAQLPQIQRWRVQPHPPNLRRADSSLLDDHMATISGWAVAAFMLVKL